MNSILLLNDASRNTHYITYCRNRTLKLATLNTSSVGCVSLDPHVHPGVVLHRGRDGTAGHERPGQLLDLGVVLQTVRLVGLSDRWDGVVVLRLDRRDLLVGERLGLVVALSRELYGSVLYRGRRAGLELHMSQDSVDQLDVLALVSHEVAAIRVSVGDHVLVGQQSVHVAAVGRRGRDLQALQ